MRMVFSEMLHMGQAAAGPLLSWILSLILLRGRMRWQLGELSKETINVIKNVIGVGYILLCHTGCF